MHDDVYIYTIQLVLLQCARSLCVCVFMCTCVCLYRLIYNRVCFSNYRRTEMAFKVYSISMRLYVNNHRSFFFYLFFIFRNVTSFGNKRCFLATTASKPCVALNNIQMVVRGLFSMCWGIDVLRTMSSSLICIHLLTFLCHFRVMNV